MKNFHQNFAGDMDRPRVLRKWTGGSPDRSRFVWPSALLLSLVACGGGGNPGPANDPRQGGTPHAQLFGTAATGLPLVGNLTVKDANGATKTTPLSSNGAYSIDVTGMTGPFLLRAQGMAGGYQSVLYSVATTADANGTINITPLTDLVVANIAGKLPDSYFEGGDFAAATQSEVDAEAAGLKAKLLPMLLAMGVDASVDLLRTPFTPLVSPLDKALDVLRVNVDPATNVATITNIVTQQQITDDLSVKASGDAGATPMDATGMATAAQDIVQIRKVFADYSAKFADGAPSPSDLLPLLTSADAVTGAYDFLSHDQDAQEFAEEDAGDTSSGSTFTDISFQRIDYTLGATNSSPRAVVDYTLKDKNGVAFFRERSVQIVKGTDGAWRIRGDGRVLDMTAHVQAIKDAATGCVTTGFQFSIEEVNPLNSSSIAAVLAKGPGLPAHGIRLARSQAGNWPVQGGDGSSYALASNCANGANGATAGLSDAQIAAIPDNAEYSLTAVDTNGVTVQAGGVDIVYKDRMGRRPLTLAEAAAASFPSLQTSSALDAFTGGELTVSAAGLNPAHAAQFHASISHGPATTSADSEAAPHPNGTLSQQLQLSVAAGPVGSREAWVSTKDDAWRELVTRQRIQ